MSDSVQDALIAADGDSRIVFWSPSAERTFGWSEEQALGQPLTMIMPERLRPLHLAGIARLRDGGEPHVLGGPPVELVGLRADGTEFPVELTLGRWRDGDTQYFTGVVRDVSERHRAGRVLAAQYGVAAALAASQELDEGIVAALAAIGTGMDWRAAQLWVVDADAALLRCRGSWHEDPQVAEFDVTSRALTLERGSGVPGRVWATGAAVWVDDVLALEEYPRRSAAEQAGLRAAVAVPLVAEGETRGVAEFYAADVRAPDQALLSSMEALGNQLGQFLLRREAEAQLAQSEQVHRQAAELNDEIVQGLALAHYQHEAGDHDLAGDTIAATLQAAKEIVSDLLEGVVLEPGRLRRSRAARLPVDQDD